ncbi:hypothetical protein E2C01_019576 [Portunus trituberculatus]|uniref:Uncharacterized protein n=1 Tax=Portunus trituberculatus TaxID=210409 RepID=A0A5B7DZR0_PORTR|nr:hypothetical protein [Portunus trituberculatus]
MSLGGNMGPNMGTTINKIACATNGQKQRFLKYSSTAVPHYTTKLDEILAVYWTISSLSHRHRQHTAHRIRDEVLMEDHKSFTKACTLGQQKLINRTE